MERYRAGAVFFFTKNTKDREVGHFIILKTDFRRIHPYYVAFIGESKKLDKVWIDINNNDGSVAISESDIILP